MPIQNIQNTKDRILEVYEDGGIFVEVRNTSGSAHANGKIVKIVPSTSTGEITLDTANITADSNRLTLLGVVANHKKGLNSIPAGGRGFVQIKGVCTARFSSGSNFSAGQYLQMAATNEVVTGSSAPAVGTFAVAFAAKSSGSEANVKVFLTGDKVNVAT